MTYDVLIIGGGPAGLSAALALGRARRAVLLVDGGPRRNAAATHVHNFLTRDGTPPAELRAAARAQLAAYPTVELRDAEVHAITGAIGGFRAALTDGADVDARRVLLATGMIDQPLPLPGFRELWGHAIVQCPYCHGYEARDRRWGYLVLPATAAHLVPFALQARAWTADLAVFTAGAVDVDDAARAALAGADIALHTAPIARLIADGTALAGVELADGTTVARDILFAHPPQRQVAVVRALGVALDDDGYVKVEPLRPETSVPGVYAAGDLTTRAQAAILAAGAGMQAAAAINVSLALDPTAPRRA